MRGAIRPGNGYEAVRVVGQHKTITDPETGFVYATHYIGGLYHQWSPEVSSRFGRPGEAMQPAGVYSWMAGEKVEFSVGPRRFAFVLEEVHTKPKAVVVRIKELRNR